MPRTQPRPRAPSSAVGRRAALGSARHWKHWPLVALGGLLSPPALAAPQAEPEEWISWNAPPECRNTREVERQLASLLGHTVEPEQLPHTRVSLHWQETRGWLVHIDVEQTGHSRGREVHTRSCTDAYDVVALTLALIIAPDLADAWEGTTVKEAEEDPGSNVEGPPPTASPTPSPPGPSEALPIPRETATREPPPPPRVSSASPEKNRLSLAAVGRVDISSLSVPIWGGGGQLAWRLGATELSVGGELLASEQTSLRRAAYPVQYSLGFGQLGACQLFPITGALRWSLCGAFQLGSLAVREQGGAELRANGLWGTLTAGSGLGASLGDRVRSDLRVYLAFPTFRHELSLTNGELAHALPSVSLQITWSVGFDVTD